MKVFILIFFCTLSGLSLATTWDEPWQDHIIKEADLLIKAEIIEKTDSTLLIEIIKDFSEENKSGKIKIQDYFMLDLCSFSEKLHIPGDVGMIGYFLLKESTNGYYSLPTPTAGIDWLIDGEVYATFRHSYNKALVKPDLYEKCYQAIWKHFHGKSYDQDGIESFIQKTLHEEPKGLEIKEERADFFEQHVALEMSYLLELSVPFETLKKFAEFKEFHSKISAFRAMSNCKNEEAQAFIVDFVLDKNQDVFVKSIALKSLMGKANEESKKRLCKKRKKLPEERPSFGGNIMDPRICTKIESPRSIATRICE